MQYLVVGDVHLTRDGSQATARDLSALLGANPGSTVVLAGDAFDLALESVREPALPAIRSVVEAHPDFRAAVGKHLTSGGRLVLLAGNHDDELVTPAGLQALCDALGLDPAERARVSASPWFARLGPGGTIHVEHGHHYDPDNALPHPLAPPDPSYWSLGIGLIHRFVAPNDAGPLVHSNDGTPLEVLRHAVEHFGLRAPVVIANYFRASAKQVLLSGPRYPGERARALGTSALSDFARRWNLPADAVSTLVAAGAPPTMDSLRDTTLRLYWDRALPTAALAVAGTSALLGGPGRRVAFGAAAVLVSSVLFNNNRYRGRVPRAMVESGERIADLTGARAVVFGHIHQPVGEGVYKNTGSFGFPGRAPGRPYVRIDDEDCAARHAFFTGATAGDAAGRAA